METWAIGGSLALDISPKGLGVQLIDPDSEIWEKTKEKLEREFLMNRMFGRTAPGVAFGDILERNHFHTR